ncbi:unnamed protein product [Brassica napus]|uniref:(rape) hypothetical protein n=1 Tax=Brassica napus TaxID=3708 RepID=A0A816IR30_BRANA|nr:unnamed protein product [Brassica napus]
MYSIHDALTEILRLQEGFNTFEIKRVFQTQKRKDGQSSLWCSKLIILLLPKRSQEAHAGKPYLTNPIKSTCTSISIRAGLEGKPPKPRIRASKLHQPFDSDGTIPSNHLHNFEHSFISMSFLVYAVLALVLDRARPRAAASEGLTIVAAAAAFSQELLLFHFQSTDHVGFEGQYHLILQLIIFVSLLTTLMGVALPKSFLVSLVRSSSIAFQGVWFIFFGLHALHTKFDP